MSFPFADDTRIQFKGDMFDKDITSRYPLGPNSIGTVEPISTPPRHFQVRWDQGIVRKYPNRDAYNFCKLADQEKLLFSDKLLENYAIGDVHFDIVEMVKLGRINDAKLMYLRKILRGDYLGPADTALLCSQIRGLRETVAKQAAMILRDSKLPSRPRPQFRSSLYGAARQPIPSPWNAISPNYAGSAMDYDAGGAGGAGAGGSGGSGAGGAGADKWRRTIAPPSSWDAAGADKWRRTIAPPSPWSAKPTHDKWAGSYDYAGSSAKPTHGYDDSATAKPTHGYDDSATAAYAGSSAKPTHGYDDSATAAYAGSAATSAYAGLYDDDAAMPPLPPPRRRTSFDESPWNLDENPSPSFDATSFDEDFETISNTFANSKHLH